MENDKLGEIALRPVTPEDREFLIEVFAASREIELSMVPWDGEQKTAFVIHQLDTQTAYYADTYPSATHDIILADGKPAGRLYVDRGQDEINILDMTVAPAMRGHGIGSRMISSLTDEAAATKRFVSVYVEPYNPSRHLFTKLGFEVVTDDGVNLRLEFRGA